MKRVALLDLDNWPKHCREHIRACEQRLRAGKYNELEYSFNSLISLGMDGKCTRCGREQV